MIYFRIYLFLLILAFALGCAAHKYSYYEKGYKEFGVASFYGSEFEGKETSSGEEFDKDELTAAHKTIPMGTKVRVKNLDNDKEVDVRINDRGPFIEDRIIDLSYKAAKKIDMVQSGTANVCVEITKLPEGAEKVPIQKGEPIYTVQVGSYEVESNALRLKEEIDEKYDDVYIATGKSLFNKYYRVRVGTFKARDDAEEFAKDLKRDGYRVLVVEKEYQQ